MFKLQVQIKIKNQKKIITYVVPYIVRYNVRNNLVLKAPGNGGDRVGFYHGFTDIQ